MGKPLKLSFRENRPSRFKRILGFALLAFIGTLIVLIAGFAYIYCITPPDASGGKIVDSIRFIVNPGQTAFKGKENMIILCCGVDMNYDERGIMYTKDVRSDTIFAVSIDAKAESINVLSIPRDTWVELSPEHGFDKINAAYVYGGIDLARICVENFLEVPIDHYVVIRVKAAENVINAIGGVDINVEKDMDYDDNWGHLHIHLKKGQQLLNGQQAVAYARFRHDEEGDWGRIRRQQQVLNALVKELKKPVNIMRMEKIASIIHDSIESDLSTAQLLDIGRLYKDFNKNDIKTGIIKGDDGGDDSYAYIIPCEEEKKALVKRLLLRDTTLMPEEIRVGILNGSEMEGQATELADTLSERGFNVTRIADAEHSDYTASKILDHLGDYDTAMCFKDYLGEMDYVGKDETEKIDNEDFTIIIGNDWKYWKERIREENARKSESNMSRNDRMKTENKENKESSEDEVPASESEDANEYVEEETPQVDEDLPIKPSETPQRESSPKPDFADTEKSPAMPTPSLVLPTRDENKEKPATVEESPTPEVTKKANIDFEYQ